MRNKTSRVSLGLALLLGGFLPASSVGAGETTAQKAMVYKSPTCGCCSKWIDHMEDNGFEVEFKNV